MSSSTSGKISAAVVLLIVVSLPAIAQNSQNSQESAEPVPYTEEEFPQWALDLRRAEIITIGMFPLAFIVSRIGYDLGRFGVLSLQRGEIAQQYAPWFFAPPNKPEFTRQEKNGIIIASVSISGMVALVDYLMARSEHRE